MDRVDISQFEFYLPASQVAQYPAKERTQSRLLVSSHSKQDTYEIFFSDLLKVLLPGDLLVCNDSRVISARLEGRKSTGGRVEILLERIVDDSCFWAQMKARRPLKKGNSVTVGEDFNLTVRARNRDLFVLGIESGASAESMFDKYGMVPLPPYIDRAVEEEDYERYQTVYATTAGSVAAPTAGLHFSKELLQELNECGVGIAYITLHIGAGTFAPIRTGDIDKQVLHWERYEFSESVCDAIERTREQGGRIIAVGTTVVRVLESITADYGGLKPVVGQTNFFIKPGYCFRVVDAMITNFHLPRSTLLMLVCAFGGTERVLDAYRFAVTQGFRFYSYGDAMFIDRGE